MNPMSIDQELRDSALGFVGLESRATDQELLMALVTIIQHPEQIDDTNGFASLLADIGDEHFIEPLVN